MSFHLPFNVHEDPLLLPSTLSQIYPDLKEVSERLEHNQIEVLAQNKDLFIVVTKIELIDRLSFISIPFVDSKTNRRIEDAFGCVLGVGGRDQGDYRIMNLKVSNGLKERDELLDLLSKWKLGIVVRGGEVVVVPLEEPVFEILKMTDPLLFSSLFYFLSVLLARREIEKYLTEDKDDMPENIFKHKG